MTQEELFRKKADTYLVCFVESCPRRAHCLRWQVGQFTPDTWLGVRCINPRYRTIQDGQCDQFRSDERVLMARGMTHTFTEDMPLRVVNTVRQTLIDELNRTYYFEYRNGTRLIPPALQQRIRTLFRESGWANDIEFDEYVEDYDW